MTTTVDMTERELTAQVVELAALLGWSRYHTWRSKHSAAGFPDETLWKGRRLVFAELKTQKGRVSDAQRRVLEGLAETPAEVYLIRPLDLDEFATVLGSVSARGYYNAVTSLNAALSAELG